MYIETIPNRGSPPAILLRESYRAGGKVKTPAGAITYGSSYDMMEDARLAAEQAKENRVRHGRTGPQKAADRQEAERREAAQSGQRLDIDATPGRDV